MGVCQSKESLQNESNIQPPPIIQTIPVEPPKPQLHPHYSFSIHRQSISQVDDSKQSIDLPHDTTKTLHKGNEILPSPTIHSPTTTTLEAKPTHPDPSYTSPSTTISNTAVVNETPSIAPMVHSLSIKMNDGESERENRLPAVPTHHRVLSTEISTPALKDIASWSLPIEEDPKLPTPKEGNSEFELVSFIPRGLSHSTEIVSPIAQDIGCIKQNQAEIQIATPLKISSHIRQTSNSSRRSSKLSKSKRKKNIIADSPEESPNLANLFNTTAFETQVMNVQSRKSPRPSTPMPKELTKSNQPTPRQVQSNKIAQDSIAEEAKAAFINPEIELEHALPAHSLPSSTVFQPQPRPSSSGAELPQLNSSSIFVLSSIDSIPQPRPTVPMVVHHDLRSVTKFKIQQQAPNDVKPEQTIPSAGDVDVTQNEINATETSTLNGASEAVIAPSNAETQTEEEEVVKLIRRPKGAKWKKKPEDKQKDMGVEEKPLTGLNEIRQVPSEQPQVDSQVRVNQVAESEKTALSIVQSLTTILLPHCLPPMSSRTTKHATNEVLLAAPVSARIQLPPPSCSKSMQVAHKTPDLVGSTSQCSKPPATLPAPVIRTGRLVQVAVKALQISSPAQSAGTSSSSSDSSIRPTADATSHTLPAQGRSLLDYLSTRQAHVSSFLESNPPQVNILSMLRSGVLSGSTFQRSKTLPSLSARSVKAKQDEYVNPWINPHPSKTKLPYMDLHTSVAPPPPSSFSLNWHDSKKLVEANSAKNTGKRQELQHSHWTANGLYSAPKLRPSIPPLNLHQIPGFTELGLALPPPSQSGGPISSASSRPTSARTLFQVTPKKANTSTLPNDQDRPKLLDILDATSPTSQRLSSRSTKRPTTAASVRPTTATAIRPILPQSMPGASNDVPSKPLPVMKVPSSFIQDISLDDSIIDDFCFTLAAMLKELQVQNKQVQSVTLFQSIPIQDRLSTERKVLKILDVFIGDRSAGVRRVIDTLDLTDITSEGIIRGVMERICTIDVASGTVSGVAGPLHVRSLMLRMNLAMIQSHLDERFKKSRNLYSLVLRSLSGAQSNLQALNLFQSNLGEKGIATVIAAVKRNPHLTNLSLVCTGLNQMGGRLVELLSDHPKLEMIDLSMNSIGDVEAAQLCNTFLSSASRITSLNLSLNSISPIGIRTICTSLISSRCNGRLKTLSLEGNNLHGLGSAEPLAQLLSHPLCSLTELSLGYCNLGVAGCRAICLALRYSTRLETLNLAGNITAHQGQNHPRENGVACLEALSFNTSLKILDIRDNQLINCPQSTPTSGQPATMIRAILSLIQVNPRLISVLTSGNGLTRDETQMIQSELTHKLATRTVPPLPLQNHIEEKQETVAPPRQQISMLPATVSHKLSLAPPPPPPAVVNVKAGRPTSSKPSQPITAFSTRHGPPVGKKSTIVTPASGSNTIPSTSTNHGNSYISLAKARENLKASLARVSQPVSRDYIITPSTHSIKSHGSESYTVGRPPSSNGMRPYQSTGHAPVVAKSIPSMRISVHASTSSSTFTSVTATVANTSLKHKATPSSVTFTSLGHGLPKSDLAALRLGDLFPSPRKNATLEASILNTRAQKYQASIPSTIVHLF